MNAESARPGRIAPSAVRAALLGFSLLLVPAAAQGAATPQPTPPKAATGPFATIPALSAAEKKTLQDVFRKVRPATLKLEDCSDSACTDSPGYGSAVLISADGLALTAYHVVEGTKFLRATTLNHKKYAASVIGYDDQRDLALLKVSVPKGTAFAPLATTAAKVGDPVLAIGNGDNGDPVADFLAGKQGRVTALDTIAPLATFSPKTLEMSAKVVPGDSGGPILNARGEVTGISSFIQLTNVSAVMMTNADPVYASHAVPVGVTDATVADLRRGTKRDAPVIGIGLAPALSSFFAADEAGFRYLSERLNLGSTPGAFFTSVSAGSPAEKAGLRPLTPDTSSGQATGDIVTEVNGKRIVNFSEFQFAVRAYQPGDTVTLTVLRAGQTIRVPITLIGRSKISN